MRFPVSVSASILAAVLLILGGTFKAAAEVRATDDRGRRISLKAPAQRIIALAPHVTELLFAAGAGRRLAGVDHYSDFPPTAAGITEVGDAGHADLERILGSGRIRRCLKSGNPPATSRTWNAWAFLFS